MTTTEQDVTERRLALRARTPPSNLWLHFSRMGAYADAPPPVIVRGEGASICDDRGKRYLDGLAGLFVVQAGHGRTRARRGRRQAGRAAGLLPDLVLRAPGGDRARRTGWPRCAPGDLNRVFFTTGGGEAVETAWKLAKQYFKLTGKPMKHKVISRAVAYHGTHAGRAVDHRRSRRSRRRSSRWCPARFRVPNTNIYRAPVLRRRPRRRSAAGPPTRSSRRSCSRARTRSPRSSSSRCRTPAAASRRRPATSSGCARSATGTTCCWSPTRSSAPSAGSARCSPARSSATCPT